MARVFGEGRQRTTNRFFVSCLWLSEIIDVLISASGIHWDILRQDLHYTARTLARARGFTLTAITVTALGIGANSAVFSITDRALLRPFPFPTSDRLVQLWQRSPAYSRVELSPPNFSDWRHMNSSFEDMAAYVPVAWNFLGEGEPQRIQGATVTPEFFKVLGVQPLFVSLRKPMRGSTGRVPSSCATRSGKLSSVGGRIS